MDREQVNETYKTVQALQNYVLNTGVSLSLRVIQDHIEAILHQLSTVYNSVDTGPKERKIIQICTAPPTTDSYTFMDALCEDGTLWRKIWKQNEGKDGAAWSRIPGIPLEETPDAPKI